MHFFLNPEISPKTDAFGSSQPSFESEFGPIPQNSMVNREVLVLGLPWRGTLRHVPPPPPKRRLDPKVHDSVKTPGT